MPKGMGYPGRPPEPHMTNAGGIPSRVASGSIKSPSYRTGSQKGSGVNAGKGPGGGKSKPAGGPRGGRGKTRMKMARQRHKQTY